MIVRIMAEGQYRVTDEHMREVQRLDDELDHAVAANDDNAFTATLQQLVEFVRQHGQIVPGAAADLQDARLGGQLAIAGQIVRQDVAARAIPPMGGVELRHAIVDDAFHQQRPISRTPTGGSARRWRAA